MLPVGEEEDGARTPLLVCSCPCPGDRTVLALLRDTGREHVSLAEVQLALFTHTQKKKSTQCPFSSNAGTERKAVSSFRHQACLPASVVPGSWPHVPLPGPGLGLPWLQPVPQSPVCALSPGELLKPNSSDSNSPSPAIYQPVSWAADSGVCFSKTQSYLVATLFSPNAVV